MQLLAPRGAETLAEGTPVPEVGDPCLDREHGQLLGGCWGWGTEEAKVPPPAPSPPGRHSHSCSIGWWQSRIPAASGPAQQAGADTGLSRARGPSWTRTGISSQTWVGRGPPVPGGRPTGPCPGAKWGSGEGIPLPESSHTGRIQPLCTQNHSWKSSTPGAK